MTRTNGVVITGLGVVSPIGIGIDEFWKSLMARRSGVRQLTTFDTSEIPVKFGGEICGFEGKKYITPRKSIKVMCRGIQLGFSAAVLAMQEAGLEKGSLDPERLGVLFGSELFWGEIKDIEEVFRHCVVEGTFVYDKWGEQFPNDIFPLWMLKYLPNMVACHVGIAYDGRGPNNTIVQGEASSLLALIEAIEVVRRGHADVMIVGGTGTRLMVSPLVNRTFANLSHRNGDPEGASRPFDARRDGMVNGEGAAAFIIESSEHAQKRGAEVLCRVVSSGNSFEDASAGSMKSGSGLQLAMTTALCRGELTPDQIGHVNADGMSMVNADAVEAQAIYEVLGDVPVMAPKSYFGNLGAGAGAVELAVSVLAISRGEVPVTLNYEQPDPACPVNVVHAESLKTEKRVAMVLNKSGTGQTASVILAGA